MATGFFIGYLPVAPATFSCFIGVVIWYFLFPFKMIYLIITAVLFMLGVVVSDSLEKEWGKDPRCIVIDEYVSILLPLYFTPVKLIPLGITLVLFRIFDIMKPPPVRNMEKLRGGWGIMLDDLLAAIYTMIIILVMRSLGIFY